MPAIRRRECITLLGGAAAPWPNAAPESPVKATNLFALTALILCVFAIYGWIFTNVAKPGVVVLGFSIFVLFMLLLVLTCFAGLSKPGSYPDEKVTLDTSRTLVIESSPEKLRVLVLAGVVLTALFMSFALLPDAAFLGLKSRWIDIVEVVYARRPVCYFFSALCILLTGVHLRRLFAAPEPVLTISSEGIRYKWITTALIPWSDISNISPKQIASTKMMVLALRPGVEDRLGLKRVTLWMRRACRALGLDDGLMVTAGGLNIDYDTLFKTSLNYAEARWSGSAEP
jgi:hypothetical protein